MISALILLLLGLTVHLNGTVENLELVLINDAGEVVRQIPASAAGEYVFDDLAAGTYTVRAMVGDTVVALIPEVPVPVTDSVAISVGAGSVQRSGQQEEGARRNQNIQVNLIDTQALMESLGRQGAQVRPITDFSAARSNYAAEMGGVGQTPQVLRTDRKKEYHGEIYETHNNHTVNARTFFQVGKVLPSRRNQYGFTFGGPLGSDRLSFLVTGEETRESGFVNGNVLVPLPGERTALAADPAARALIQKWINSYPDELPNRPEIDARLLNTNALQTTRNTGGSIRLDWQRTERRRFSTRYSFADNFLDSYELVGGQNPDQNLRPQTLNLAMEQRVSDRSGLQLGINYVRQKIHILVPPAAVGPYVIVNGIESLGPPFQMPILRVSNDFEYIVQGSHRSNRHETDWGGFLQRSQLNEYQADGARSVFNFQANLGRSAIENFRLGDTTRYTKVLGDLYRGFRRTNIAAYANDRIRLTSNLSLTLGLRYEFAGRPSEVNGLTEFSYDSDSNNFAPRIGLAWARGATTVRMGYGIAYGSVFPATYSTARLNPPNVIYVRMQSPDLIDPLRDFELRPGQTPRAGLNLIDPELVTPYSQHYTLEVSRVLPGAVNVRAAYVGNRTWKLFRIVRENRAEPVEGIPFTTRTTDLRRRDQTALSIARMANQARSYFDAGQFSVDRVFGQGVALRAAYTWSKALDTGSDFSNPGTNQQERVAQNESIAVRDLKARSSFDVPHSLVLGYSFDLPTRFLKGWTILGTTIFKDGTPFTVETGTDSPPFGNGDGERGDRPSIFDTSLSGASVDDPDTALRILRRDAFDAEAPSRRGYGNLSRNAFRKDGTANFNLAVSRTFGFADDRALLFRAEFINALNHPQFAPPNFRWTDDSFGQITDTVNDGRIIQFHLRLSF